jgi:hypothetical protein
MIAASQELFRLGVQYYATARAAARFELMPTSGNQFHHAIEMMLKADLAKTESLPNLKNKYRHHLKKLWGASKLKHPASALSAFDALIDIIDRFEEIRYPDQYLADGAVIVLEWGSIATVSTPATHVINVADVDALVDQLFTTCSMNPKAFIGTLNVPARDAVKFENVQYSKWGVH